MRRAPFPTMVPRRLAGTVSGFGPVPWNWRAPWPNTYYPMDRGPRMIRWGSGVVRLFGGYGR